MSEKPASKVLLSAALQKLTGSRTWLRRVKTPRWKPKHVNLLPTALVQYFDPVPTRGKTTGTEVVIVPGGAREATHNEQLQHGKKHLIVVTAVDVSEASVRSASVRTLRFAANTSFEVKEWVDMLNQVSFERMGVRDENPFVHPFLQAWGHVARLRVKDVIEVAREMNFKLSEDRLQQLWEEVHGGRVGREISPEQFLAVMTRLAINESLKNTLHGASGSSWTEELDAQQLGRVLGQSTESATAMLNERNVKKCNLSLLLHFLYSPVNSIVDPNRIAEQHDMAQPLNRYLISSSHNTYLTGDQFSSDSSAEMYRIVLERGCRCVEIDIWDGDDGKPIVRHGHTITSSEALHNVLEAINLHAFSHGNPYPVILSIENHMSKEQQLIAARMIKNVFGERLYAPGKEERLADSLPSPEVLRQKIVLKAKTSTSIYRPEYERSLAPGARHGDSQDDDSDIDEMQNTSAAGSSTSTELPKPSVETIGKVVPELSELVFLAGGNRKALTPLWMEGISGKDRYLASSCVSINEKKVYEMFEKSCMDTVREYNAHGLTRTYPKATRVDSSNYNPLLAHAMDCQIVALNWQCNDVGLAINQARFLENRGCGYVLPKKIPEAERRATLQLRILSAFLLPRPKKSVADAIKRDVIDPYCRLKVYDANFAEEDDYCTFKTSTPVARSNGFAPSWEHAVSIPIIHRGLAVLNFNIYDRDRTSGDDLIGYSAVPVHLLRTGTRSLHLNGPDGMPLKFAGKPYQPAILCDVKWK